MSRTLFGAVFCTIVLTGCADELFFPPGSETAPPIETRFTDEPGWVCAIITLEKHNGAWQAEDEQGPNCTGDVELTISLHEQGDVLLVSFLLGGVPPLGMARLAADEVVAIRPAGASSPRLASPDSVTNDGISDVWFVHKQDRAVELRWQVPESTTAFGFPLWVFSSVGVHGIGAPRPEAQIDPATMRVSNEIAVVFRDSIEDPRRGEVIDSIAQSLEAAVSVIAVGTYNEYAFRWEGDAGLDQDQVLSDVKRLSIVETAWPEVILTALHRVPADSGWSDYPSGEPSSGERYWTWSQENRLRGNNWGWKAVDMPLAWSCQTEGASTAVVDIGFSRTGALNADLEASRAVHIVESEPGNFKPADGLAASDSDHGLAVAGVLAASGNNGEGLTGVRWSGDFRLYQVPELDAGSATALGIVAGVRAALSDGAKVVNLSFGYQGRDKRTADAIGSWLASALRKQILSENASSNFLVVIAAGKGDADASTVGFPQVAADSSFQGLRDRVIVVGAAKRDSTRRRESNRGSLVEIFAPGDSIETLAGLGAGTSLAAPFVAGAASLIWAFDPSLTPKQVKDKLIDGAQTGGVLIPNDGRMTPQLNVYESLRSVAANNPSVPPCGMVAVGVPGALQFWRLERDASGVKPALDRTVPLDIAGWIRGIGGLDHGYRSHTLLALRNKRNVILKADLATGTATEITNRPGTQTGIFGIALRSFADSAIVGGENIFVHGERGIRFVEYPSLEVLALPIIDHHRIWTWIEPYALSHDRRLLVYPTCEGSNNTHCGARIIRLEAGGQGSVNIYRNAGNLHGPWVYETAMSPRGDAAALRVGRWDPIQRMMREWLVIVRFPSTIYEDLASHTAHRVDFASPDKETFVSVPRFLPDGRGLVFNGIKKANVDEADRICSTYYLDVKELTTHELFREDCPFVLPAHPGAPGEQD